jgi:hypothetical protein
VTIYEIVNPSDPYTIEGDLRPCAMATILLGEGWYALTDAEGNSAMPILALGDVGDKWAQEQFDGTLQELMDGTPNEEIAAALDTVLIGLPSERETITAVLDSISDPAEREQARAIWLDKKRSSMNNIGGRAVALAKALRSPSPVAR